MNTSAEMPTDIAEYHAKQTSADQEICQVLFVQITQGLPEAQGKVWHGHPVWFIEGNPVVGYHRQKDSVRVLFWSGQSFGSAELVALGSFKAAGFAVPTIGDLNLERLAGWLALARKIQWDYKGLPKKRELTKLTDF